MFSNLRSGFFGLRYSTLTAIAATIVALVVVYLLYRWLRQRNRSKYGFRITGREEVGGADTDVVQRTLEAFIVENDAPIRDVLADYIGAHPDWEAAPHEAGRWTIRLKSGRRGNLDDCFVRCYTAPSYEDGRLGTTVEIHLPDNLSDRQVLHRALERVIRKSKSGRRVTLNYSRQW